MTLESAPLLEVADLRVELGSKNGPLRVVRDVGFSLRRGEALGIVGESGSGKSMTALALMGLLPRHATRTARRLRLADCDLLSLSEPEYARSICGQRIAMVFQDPMSSLNPVYTIGRQMTEMLTHHNRAITAAEARSRALLLLEKARVPAARSRLGQYPHQLSGGLRQRVMIAMMLMNEPDVLIADEPTTALDVTIQAQILGLLGDLRHELGMALILITHDIGVVSHVADTVAVMYAGEIVEQGPADQVLRRPQHPYTKALLDCAPRPCGDNRSRLGSIPGNVPSLASPPPGCAFTARCHAAQPSCAAAPVPLQTAGDGHGYRCVIPPGEASRTSLPPDGAAAAPPPAIDGGDTPTDPSVILSARKVTCGFPVRRGLLGRTARLRAVDGVSLDLGKGEIVALVGESGCGKSTLAKILLGIQKPDAGEVLLNGRRLDALPPLERARLMQPVFQDPSSSLNPRRLVGEIIRRPLDVHGVDDVPTRQARVEETMDLIGLPRRLLRSYPAQLSGGQRQRVAIARAIILRPHIVVFDEPTSALDLSVQAQILNLLLDLRDTLGLSIVIITHDLAVVGAVAGRVAVMYLGQIVEQGPSGAVLDAPRHPYTRALLKSVLTPMPGAGLPADILGAALPDPLKIPSGCRFHPRCPEAFGPCATQEPSPCRLAGGHELRCHLHMPTPSARSVAVA